MDESKLRSLHAQAQYDQVTRELLAAYGREIFGFMRARMGNEDQAKEAYSHFAVNVWRGMAGFRGQCPFRAWAYAIARNALHRQAAEAGRAARQTDPLEDSGNPALAELVRTQTAEYLRTEVKSRFAALRDKLSEEDQTLLVLRVDKRMEWRDVAAVMLGPDAARAECDREATRLRQQFKTLKERLKELARAEGLISDDSE